MTAWEMMLMASYLGYWWAVLILVVTGARWKQLSLALMRLLSVLAPSDRVRRCALEVIRLDRPDAAEMPSYLVAGDTEKAQYPALASGRGLIKRAAH